MRKNAAIGIVFNKNMSQVLLVKRRDVPVWVLPGGGIENDEDSSRAVVREVLEETGLKVEVIRKVAEYTPINKLARFTELYECRSVEGVLTKGPETQAVAFFSVHQLPKDLFFVHEEWLRDGLKNFSEPICRPLDSITYWNFTKYFLRHPFRVILFLLTLMKNKE